MPASIKIHLCKSLICAFCLLEVVDVPETIGASGGWIHKATRTEL